MPDTTYNVSFILDHAVVIATVWSDQYDTPETIIEKAKARLRAEEGIDVGRAPAEVEEAYV